MGCNHCLEPSCLIGCPVEAYTKDPVTGVVIHDADTCIGCQYCTWNCSYGVPQYNPERGVVGKCDMCHNRLDDGMAPACVAACPEGAIAIEIVNIEEWRRDYLQRERARLAIGRRQHFHDANHACRKICRPNWTRRHAARSSGTSALAAGFHAGADAAFGGRIRHAVALDCGSRRGCGCGVGIAGDRRDEPGPGDPASRAARFMRGAR